MSEELRATPHPGLQALEMQAPTSVPPSTQSYSAEDCLAMAKNWPNKKKL